MVASNWSVSAVHYIAPLLTIAFFYGSQIHSNVVLKEASSEHNSNRRRRTLLWNLAGIEATYVVQAGFYLWQALFESTPPRFLVVSCILFALAYGSIISAVLTSSGTIWRQHIGTYALALALQLAVLSSGPTLPVECVRLLLLAVACAHSIIANTHVALDATEPPAQKSSLFDDEWEDPEDEEYKTIKKQQEDRLEESGSWLAYLKPYKIFLPLVWPVGNVKLQCCIAFLVCHLMVSRLFGILVPRQMGIIADKLTTGDGDFPVREILVWAALTVCESDLFVTLRDMAFTPVSHYAWRTISATAFGHVMNLSMDFHNDKSSAETIRVVEQGQALSDIMYFVCFEAAPLIADVVIAVIYITTSFDPYMALIMLVGGFVYAWLGMISARMSVAKRKQYITATTELDKIKYEGLSNWQTVTQFNRNAWETFRYEKLLDKYCEASDNMQSTWNLIHTLQKCVLTLARAGATALAMYRVAQGEIPIGQLVTFTAVWSTVMNPVTSLTWVMRRVQSMLTDSERLLRLLQIKPTVTDKPDAKPLDLKAGKVELQHVDFSYDARKNTLQDISFVAKPGMTVALVGETGGGKSTLMKLLYRYYDISQGSIRIDGQDIRDVTLDSLREVFGVVPQDPALFNSTLIENLRYARLDATDEEIADACRAACIHDKIMQFPDKYNSKVGERGIKLSGGEMQRVAIARAILRNPKIVLLDEATSQIDAETEHEIQRALKGLTVGRTTFVVAHRLSTIQHADLILVIENGKIIERGNHEKLFSQNGKYVSLWSKQMSKAVEVATPGIRTPPTSEDGDSGSETEQAKKLRDAVARRYVKAEDEQPEATSDQQ